MRWRWSSARSRSVAIRSVRSAAIIRPSRSLSTTRRSAARQWPQPEDDQMVEVRVPAPLRAATEGARVVQGEGGTVGELLADLTRRYPGIKPSLFDTSGGLRQFVNVYVNDEDIR